MKNEQLRKWKRYDATTYKALYNIQNEAMSVRFEYCVSLIESFIENFNVNASVESDSETEIEDAY